MILNSDDLTKAAEVATLQKNKFLINKISTSRTIPVQPSPSITARKKSESDGLDDCYCYNDEQQYSMGLLAGGRIQMKLIISLVFALLPGVSLVPLLASSAVAAAPNNEVRMISSSFSPEQQQQQERGSTADAARFLLDDVQRTTNKRQKQSIMKQMTLDDQRLAQCEEESLLSSGKNVMDWEQCFFYGTTNGVSSRSPSNSASTSASGDGKNKLLYDINNDEDRYKTSDERIPLPSSSSFGNNAAKISSGEMSKIPTW
jgi:hypothetical protein